jgi:hypothetical protein
MLLDVISVKTLPDYVLLLEFENGEKRRFDMTPYMDRKPYIRIKQQALFKRAFVDYGTVVWPGEIDVAPETLYDLSVPVEEKHIAQTNSVGYRHRAG